MYVNASGWESSVTCAGSPAIGVPVARLPWTPNDGAAHFAWHVGFTHDWELLVIFVWIDWDTGECIFECPPYGP